MVRYLSTEWFDLLRADAAAPGDRARTSSPAGPLVLRQVVHDAPSGEVRYDVVVDAGSATIRYPAEGSATLTFSGDYATAAAVAGGRLSAQAALAEGRLRVGGDLRALSTRLDEVAGLDPVPAGVRAETEF